MSRLPSRMSAFGAMSLLVMAALSSCRSAGEMTETGFLNRTVTVNGTVFPYVVYVPRDWTPSRRLPVLLFLHGSGERGSDGLKQTQVGVGSAIRFAPERFPMIVVMPQARVDSRWLGEDAAAAMLSLDQSTAEFHGDPDRTYLTGLSLGGYGVWHLALAHPERFAALVPVCGGLLEHPTAHTVRRSPLVPAEKPYEFVAEHLRGMPIWIFHGSDDPIIPVTESRQLAGAFAAAGSPVRYTELPGVGHGAWDQAYGTSDLWSWLLAQQRTATGAR